MCMCTQHVPMRPCGSFATRKTAAAKKQAAAAAGCWFLTAAACPTAATISRPSSFNSAGPSTRILHRTPNAMRRRHNETVKHLTQVSRCVLRVFEYRISPPVAAIMPVSLPEDSGKTVARCRTAVERK